MLSQEQVLNELFRRFVPRIHVNDPSCLQFGYRHTLLFVFQRSAGVLSIQYIRIMITFFFFLNVPLAIPGTNLDVRQRLALFFMYICCIMVGTALFYGRDQSTVWLDIAVSFITSLFGKLPQFAIRHIFQKTKPRKTDSTKMRRVSSVSRRRSLSISRQRSSSGGAANLTESARNSPRFHQVSDIRMRLFRKKYKYPSKCREIAWCILLFTSITGCITAILYGLSFDLSVTPSINEDHANAAMYASDCWSNLLHLRVEDELSEEHFNEAFVEREQLNAGSYAGSDTGSWLLSLAQSLLLSLFFWQPLMTYIMTWCKVWMFTWHLEMKVMSIHCLLSVFHHIEL